MAAPVEDADPGGIGRRIWFTGVSRWAFGSPAGAVADSLSSWFCIGPLVEKLGGILGITRFLFGSAQGFDLSGVSPRGSVIADQEPIVV